jgi:predicted ribonuclease toxin of YeeF-YezG toxin-antitoxin module
LSERAVTALFFLSKIYQESETDLMTIGKWQQRFEAKLDALLKAQNVEFEEAKTRSAPEPKLSAADQQAIDNAPNTPIGSNGPQTSPTRTDANNAPSTDSSVPADAVGTVTVETEQPDGTTTVDTVDTAKAAKPKRVNWNS